MESLEIIDFPVLLASQGYPLSVVRRLAGTGAASFVFLVSFEARYPQNVDVLGDVFLPAGSPMRTAYSSSPNVPRVFLTP